MYSHYQTQYFAWQLTPRLASEDEDKLTGAIMDAQIDLNPHQVDPPLSEWLVQTKKQSGNLQHSGRW